MKPRLGMVELGLALLAAWAAWAYWTGAQRAAARYGIFAASASSQRAAPEPADPLARAVRPAAYSSILSHDPFSANRGANVRPAARPAARPAPGPLPELSGIADLGDGPAALLAVRPGEKPRWIAPGEQAGSYRLEAIDGDRLTFSYPGGRVSVSAADLQDETRRRASRPRATSGRPARPLNSSSSSLGGSRPSRGRYRIGAEFRPGRFTADATDGAPDGTVYEGYVRRVRQSPFGAQHWWEKQE